MPMFPDVRFEATFLRAALLAGVAREADACTWAEALLHDASDEQGLLADVALAPTELTAMREALRPLALESLADDAGAALLAYLVLDPAAAELAASDRLRVLTVLRREGLLTDATARAVKEFEDRQMMASVDMPGESAPSHGELTAWLNAERPSAYFRVTFDHDDAQAAFLAALSRVVVRERRSAAVDPIGRARAWTAGQRGTRRGPLVLNESLWIAARQAFSPLPVGSRIPYVTLPANATVVLDAASASPMGADDAAALLTI